MLRKFIFSTLAGCEFEDRVKKIFDNVFRKMMSGNGVTRLQYDMATLLDPRYGYRKDLYADTTWNAIEEKATHALALKFDKDRNEMNIQFINYRVACNDYRLNPELSPLGWWITHQRDFQFLAAMARELFSCPAVTIDADYFFGDGGKFVHLCRSECAESLGKNLAIAGYTQQFRGRGLRAKPDGPVTAFIDDPYPPPLRQWVRRKQEASIASDLNENSLKRKILETRITKIVKENQAKKRERSPTVSKTEHVKVEEPSFDMLLLEEKPATVDVPNLVEDKVCTDDVEKTAQKVSTPLDKPPKYKKKAMRCNRRRCTLCFISTEGRNLKETKVEKDRLMVIWVAQQRGKITIKRGAELFQKSRTVVCRRHFIESCDYIRQKLNVESYQDITKLPRAMHMEFERSAALIWNRDFAGREFAETCYVFLQKYQDFMEFEDDSRIGSSLPQDNEIASTPDNDGQFGTEADGKDVPLCEEKPDTQRLL
uniref:Dimer_Tnp_hAT domain-containing protein n=1 Tax=Caenorhabditis japonica TaxID=281687 RepID=A0A8R1DVV8_CAEJA